MSKTITEIAAEYSEQKIAVEFTYDLEDMVVAINEEERGSYLWTKEVCGKWARAYKLAKGGEPIDGWLVCDYTATESNGSDMATEKAKRVIEGDCPIVLGDGWYFLGGYSIGRIVTDFITQSNKSGNVIEAGDLGDDPSELDGELLNECIRKELHVAGADPSEDDEAEFDDPDDDDEDDDYEDGDVY